jgi:hypothetical protein
MPKYASETTEEPALGTILLDSSLPVYPKCVVVDSFEGIETTLAQPLSIAPIARLYANSTAPRTLFAL